jgi:hypothetical protein
MSRSAHWTWQHSRWCSSASARRPSVLMWGRRTDRGSLPAPSSPDATSQEDWNETFLPVSEEQTRPLGLRAQVGSYN